MGEKDHDLDLVREWGIIPTLLKPIKSPKVIVLLGKGYAWTLESDLPLVSSESREDRS
jgi:hypothetical protein